ncbi:hypothetical protein HUT18_09865 [Streptomyces sp. NA04227]|uniref:PASTA domain-containing protein n=1 Tax=Streptomyces sp. NA04227 TaxID=2742136 RepID=UPI0015924B3F|nr:PASTA domain-containing protein [Streptomyces sp. NA04227]QKW06663.1 hypothetical protein HUT18_09865 [Streptomyces sp. NA04227]
MRIHTIGGAVAVSLVSILGLAACGDSGTDESPPTSNPTDTSTGKDDAKKADLPNMVGKGLQNAQDAAQKAGFYNLTSHDALGRARTQAFDRNWKVCSQTPTPGSHSTDTKVDFGAVKVGEDCPASDQGEPTKAGDTMPDLKNKGVKAARQALDSGTTITVKDASGQDRIIALESNWKVCSQEPAAGTKLDGQPVTLNAVKTDESC